MELTLLTSGHFFTAPFLSTHWKGELSSHSWESLGVQEFIAHNTELKDCSYPVAAISWDLPVDTPVNKDSGPS
jgi:hypothetical protein